VVGGNQFATFAQLKSGAVTQAPGSPITAIGTTQACTTDPSNAFILAAYNNFSVVSYRINSDSSATSVATSVTTAPTSAMAEVGGRFVYLAELFRTSSFGVFALSATGTLQGLPDQITNAPALDLISHPSSPVLIASQNPQALQAFSIDATTGQPISLTLPFTGFGGAHLQSMTFAQQGAFLLVAEGTQPSFPVDVLTINPATGVFTPVGTSLNVAGSFMLVTHPNQSFVYALSANAITQLSIDTRGFLTISAPAIPLPAGFTPTAAAIDNTGTNLYVTGSNGALIAFALAPTTGVLSTAPVSTTNLNFTPACVFVK
jgi:6-phosphogluconolactonase (cycloisomerase 2 family)